MSTRDEQDKEYFVKERRRERRKYSQKNPAFFIVGEIVILMIL